LGRVGFFLSLLLRFLFLPLCETENVLYPRRSIGKHKKRQNLKDDDRAIGVETSFSLFVSAGSYLAIESKVHHNWQGNLNCFCCLELNRMRRRRGGWNQIKAPPPPPPKNTRGQQGSTERSARPRPFCCSSSLGAF
jgi:hypothetical protein